MSDMPPETRTSQGEKKVERWKQELFPYLRKRPLDLENSCLIVVDMQKFFTCPESHACMPNAPRLEKNISRLLSAFRSRKLPVVFTRHSHPLGRDTGALGRWWRDPIMEDNPLAGLKMEPMPEEYVLIKDRYDAFFENGLEKVLADRGVKELVITGVMTDLCVETTSRSAFVRDYDVTVVMDATDTQDENLHLSALRTLAHGFAIIKSTNEILEEMRVLP
ncbi:MAG: cysteine hydrolase [Candidatus Thermoplasmatota archaeon]|nr:cysteine hydrolase [Candidatus Thermoplasmatota archaeon]